MTIYFIMSSFNPRPVGSKVYVYGVELGGITLWHLEIRICILCFQRHTIQVVLQQVTKLISPHTEHSFDMSLFTNIHEPFLSAIKGVQKKEFTRIL